MKQLIVITTPHFIPYEEKLLIALFEAGLERLHLRKPAASSVELGELISAIPPVFHPRIVLHDAFGLVASHPSIGGIHLNRRNPVAPGGFAGSISRSCHSLEEVAEGKSYDYQFLSLLFPSISKEGYGSSFPPSQLQEASEAGIINDKVIALGGMDATTIPQISHLGFGGVAVLGAVWGKTPSWEEAGNILNHFKQIQLCLQKNLH